MSSGGLAVRVNHVQPNHCQPWVVVEGINGCHENVVVQYPIVVKETKVCSARHVGSEVPATRDSEVRAGAHHDVGDRVVDIGFAVVYNQDDLNRRSNLTTC